MVKLRLEKSGLPNRAAMSGVTRSLTNAVITTPNAMPMTTPIARSTTLPLSRNALKPLIARISSRLRNRQHDLAELARCVEARQSALHVRQRIDAVNYRPEARVDRFQHRFELTRVAHCRPQQARMAEEKSRHADLGLDARGRAARDDAPAQRQRAHRLLQQGLADVLAHDVDSIPGGATHRVAEVCRIENGLRAQLERPPPFGL